MGMNRSLASSWLKSSFSTRRILNDQRGSISILILGLFMLTLITLIILTDISSIYIAKRALTQATEAAAQRGVKNLDLEKYYTREYNANRFVVNLFGNGEQDPGIPIDCEKGQTDSIGALRDWNLLGGPVSRKNLRQIKVEEFQCDGYEIGIRSSAKVALPFVLPFIGIEEVDISSRVGTFAERKTTTNYYGLNVG
jgi:hypothetical protein